ncbi:mite allergen Der f 3-like [Schistocerca nitens]|uniref:mite allergen Der f 3-like n=1 Tax=Schistocerca nitens TaxID=7011 RepID=UPI00211948CC|nr:mite allergen Der f 3-like [Schistocerca nitens]
MPQAALLLLLIVASVKCAPGGVVPREASALQGRIVNGILAAPGEFPHQVSLQRKPSKSHMCGASVLNQHWALTAAHCVQVEDTFEVLAGTNSLGEGGTRHTVTAIETHVAYDPNDVWVNDITVVRVSPAFPIDGVKVAPIQLPEQGEEVPDGANVTVIGWGNFWYNGLSPIELRKVDVQVTSQEECEAVWNDYGRPIYPTQICAARFDDKTYGPCHGDSGGPLLYEGKIVGIASWGYACGEPPYPSVYTRVSSYVDWIIEKTNASVVY